MRSQRVLRTVATLLAVAATAVVLVLAIGRLPDVTTSRLPGAAGGRDTYSVTAMFRDVLDLVPNSTVRLADVPVGRVTGIDVASDATDGKVAKVTMAIDSHYQLPATTVATIRSTSLLGEKYVALTAPDGANATVADSLRTARTIPLSRTTDDVEVEQLLASLGALLNGGGLQQLASISHELSDALGGHEQDTRALLGNLDAIVGELDQSRSTLVSAIDATAKLSAAYAAQDDVLGKAVRDLDPASGVLARQQSQLTTALRSLDTLHRKATHVIEASTADTVHDLKALAPTLTQLGKVADLIPENVTLLVTYPFADTAVPAFSGVYGAIKGSVVVDLNELIKAVSPIPQNTADGTAPDFGPSASSTGGTSHKPSASAPTPSSAPSTGGTTGGLGSLLGLLGLGGEGAS